ncbi:MAG: FitA-like ribbon-helix-helix domain-containing protein [Mycobacteriales bacterium]
MSTIQIRELPDEVAETYRRRAKEAGKSLQSYMREQLIQAAHQRTKAEAMAIVERTLANDPSPGISKQTIEEARRELRGE